MRSLEFYFTLSLGFAIGWIFCAICIGGEDRTERIHELERVLRRFVVNPVRAGHRRIHPRCVCRWCQAMRLVGGEQEEQKRGQVVRLHGGGAA
jgi:hypothetical protein